jgi:hypothetical protein
VFTVVHYGDNANRWLYLDSGLDIGQSRKTDTVGSGDLPNDWYADRKWWARLIWAKLSYCERVG